MKERIKKFKETYFDKIAEIWQDYFDGKLSRTEREGMLSWYRTKLNECNELEEKHES